MKEKLKTNVNFKKVKKKNLTMEINSQANKMIKYKHEKNRFKKKHKKLSQLGLTQLTRNPGYDIKITPWKVHSKKITKFKVQ